MQEVFMEVLKYAIYMLIVGLIPVLIYGIKRITDALIEYLGTKTDNEILQEVMKEILGFVSDAVTYVAQTYVDSLKKKGEFTKEAQQEAFNKAKEAAMSYITEDSRELFESVYGDLDEYVKMLIETEVRNLKMQSIVEPVAIEATPGEKQPTE